MKGETHSIDMVLNPPDETDEPLPPAVPPVEEEVADDEMTATTREIMAKVDAIIAPILDHAIEYRETLEAAGYSRENAERVSSELHAGMVKLLMSELIGMASSTRMLAMMMPTST